MNLLRFLEFLAGVVLIVLVFHDIFQGVVVPRWSSRKWRIGPYFVDKLWHLWRRLGERRRDVESREDFLGSYAPTALMLLLALWVALLITGYGLCFWALRAFEEPAPHNFFEAIYVAGETLLTIGYGDFKPVSGLSRFVALSAGASGLAVFALVISFLFTLYGTFERREVLIVTLDARAGNPPSGVALLENYAELDLLDDLPRFFDNWEEWSAQVLQSHIAYPILPFFRSSHEGESWIAALGAVLDAATLLTTTVCTGSKCGTRQMGAAHIMIRIGCHTVIDLSHWFGFRHDEDLDPRPGVEKSEFLLARRHLLRAGFVLREEEESWADFSKQRAVYALSLNELAKHFAAPPAQWVGDRSMIGLSAHRLPEKGQRNSSNPNQNTDK
ncbi:Ion channel [Abditibacterium utsteinense]|uniref:Ion channel n=1 Tax=Abditibacterium utsteinense TaxID=1960156 RepID=A0A2S8SW97_9BACT|nr:potassium channel family protein [Abditibacterium utsteinense]PQV65064.1 Ion channel [Abditibacterium utsteinense]